MKNICYYWFLLIGLLIGNLQAEVVSLVAPTHSVKEFVLKNGMKICLKQTDYEKGHVVFQLFAMGGFSSLSQTDRPSAQLASAIAWESGLGELTGDQFFIDLYEKSIDMKVEINPFDRQIEGACSTELIEDCLKNIHLLFTAPKFKKEALKHVLETTRDQLKNKASEIRLTPEETYLKYNTQDWDVFRPLSISQLDFVNLNKAQNFFKKCFSNPSEFVLVIVGDFDNDKMLAALETYLEAIPSSEVVGPQNSLTPSFPQGLTKAEESGFSHYKKTMTRLTFPIPSIKIDPSTTASLDLMCKLLKKHLLAVFLEKYDSKKKLEINYQFPLFPLLDETWITIQFSSLAKDVTDVKEEILKELRLLIQNGPTDKEVAALQQDLNQEDLFNIEENSYVLSLLSNYYRWQWNLADIKPRNSQTKIEKEVIKNDLKTYLNLDQYSLISLHP